MTGTQPSLSAASALPAGPAQGDSGWNFSSYLRTTSTTEDLSDSVADTAQAVATSTAQTAAPVHKGWRSLCAGAWCMRGRSECSARYREAPLALGGWCAPAPPGGRSGAAEGFTGCRGVLVGRARGEAAAGVLSAKPA